jgi:hypothetical protein
MIPYEFDAEWWVNSAIAAGMEPMLTISGDGKRGLFTRLEGVDQHHEPPALVDPAQRDAVADELARRGLVQQV